MITLAKALGGGLPIGAMLAAEHCAAALQPGYHGSTFGGNPVTCAAALAAFELLSSDDVLANTVDIGRQLTAGLSQYGEVTGRGLMIGVAVDASVDAKQVVSDLLFEQHVIANATGPSRLRFLPPLVAGPEHVDHALDALAEVFPN